MIKEATIETLVPKTPIKVPSVSDGLHSLKEPTNMAVFSRFSVRPSQRLISKGKILTGLKKFHTTIMV
jgi:hypothetical protein